MSPVSDPVIVYVLRRYPQLSETFVRNEVHALREAGVSVQVFSLGHGDDAAIDPSWAGPFSDVPPVRRARAVVHLLWWATHHPCRFLAFAGLAFRAERQPSGLSWCRVPALARSLTAQPVAACHTHFAWEGLLVVVLLARLLGVPSSATVHAHDIYVPDEHLPVRLGALHRLVTVCRFNVQHLRSAGLWRGPVDVVPCGVQVPEVVVTTPTDGPPRIISVGRLVEKKGMLTLVEAVALVRQRHPGVVLDIIGDGPQRADLQAAVDHLDLGEQVRLLGARSHDDALTWIEQASVFALACQVDDRGDSDALPVVLREAMARARPIVTTAVAGIPEIVDGSTGWLVAPGDATALADGLCEVLTDPVEAAARGRAARELTRRQGSLDETVRGMRRVFGLEVPAGVDPEPCTA